METKTVHRDLSSADTIEVRHGQEPEMDSLENDLSTIEVTHQSVNEHFELAAESILPDAKKICVLLASGIEFETAENSRVTG